MQEEIKKASIILKNGGIILYPTDTIWGIGCDATNYDAVQKIIDIKKRSKSKSFIVLVENEIRLEQTIEEVPKAAWDLIKYSEKPLTIIYDRPKGIASNAINSDNSLGVRLVRDYFCEELIRLINKPIISTSANLSGKPSAKCFSDISDEIKNSVDHIVNLRQNYNESQHNSSIIKLNKSGLIKIIRA
tara:strand:+ start:350 stop:913 length:564 start_codon:yes stop_codon:yes gene_type:complete